MDRTAWIVVTLCTAVLIFLYGRNMNRQLEKQAQPDPITEEVRVEEPLADEPIPVEPEADQTAATSGAESTIARLSDEDLQIENEEVLFEFSQQGGGIQIADLKNQRAYPEGDILLNEYSKTPIGTIIRRDEIRPLQLFEATKPDDQTLIFKGVNESKIEITKTFKVSKEGEEGDPHVVELQVDLTNTSEIPHEATDYSIYTGAIAPMHPKESAMYLLYNWSENGEADFERVGWFKGGGFLFFKSAPREVLKNEYPQLQWAGPCNQFYASVVIPEEVRGASIWARRFPIEFHGSKDRTAGEAIHGGLGLPPISLSPGATQSFRFKIYTGPREYKRLEQLGQNMSGLMHYDDMPIIGGMFGLIPLISRSLLSLMIWLQSITFNWGVAILIITCLIRCLIWPLHAKSTATMKRMSKLSPMMNELREKHKDDPQKMQQETMKLYRDYGVNPLSGCLPVFLQLPIFLGFYKMLASAVELRNKEFLWVKDLSMPDAIYIFENFSFLGVSSINLMPLLMAVTMVIQMQVAPKAGDKMQQRIFMLMPLIFLFICYNFASALALYWTGQNIFSIGQTWLMNRKGDAPLVKRKPKERMNWDPRKQNAPKKKAKKRPPRTGG